MADDTAFTLFQIVRIVSLKDLGLRYAQGYLFGRPRDPMTGPILNSL